MQLFVASVFFCATPAGLETRLKFSHVTTYRVLHELLYQMHMHGANVVPTVVCGYPKREAIRGSRVNVAELETGLPVQVVQIILLVKSVRLVCSKTLKQEVKASYFGSKILVHGCITELNIACNAYTCNCAYN